MQTVGRFEQPEQAHLFRSRLEAEGIPAHLFDEHVIQWFWYYSDAMGGVRVVVADGDFSRAEAVYRAYLDEQRRNRSETTVARGGFWVVLLFLITGVPALIFGRRRVASGPSQAAKEKPSDGSGDDLPDG